jgi:hypothetical protein
MATTPPILIVDDFLSSDELATLQADVPKRALFNWFQAAESPKCRGDRLAHTVWVQKYAYLLNLPLIGVEWWTHYFEAHSQSPPTGFTLSPHTDTDEYLARKCGLFKHPEYCSVFYPFVSSDLRGGRLLVWNLGPGQDGVDSIPGYQPTEVIPRTNRLVIFRGDRAHAISRIQAGARWSLALNAWAHQVTSDIPGDLIPT